jgi:hypothetical protein
MVTTTTYTTTWNPTTHEAYDTLKGRDVVSADNEKLGTIAAIFHPKQAMPEARGGHYFLVKPGMLKSWFGQGSEVYVPESAIADVTDDAVLLTYPKDQLEAQGWHRQPDNLARFNRA